MPETTAVTRSTRRNILFAAAAAGGLAALSTQRSEADTVPGSAILLGRKNGGLSVSKPTNIVISAGVGKPVLQLKNVADAGTGLRAIADLAVDARGSVNVDGRLRVTGGVALAGAKSGMVPSGANSVTIDFPELGGIPDDSILIASTNTAGAPAVRTVVKSGASSLTVTLESNADKDTTVSALITEVGFPA